MLCGRLPVEGESLEVMERIIRGEVTPALELNPELDAQLARIVTRALATSRGARFQSAEELQQALWRWLATRTPFFTDSTLKHLMGWLYTEELKALGRPRALPQEFLSHVALWRDSQGAAEGAPAGSLGGRPTLPPEDSGPAPVTSVLGTRPEEDSLRETDVVPKEAQAPGVTGEHPRRQGRSLRWVLGTAAVAGALLLVFLVVHGPPPLEIHSEPPGAQVRIDGEIRGVTPLVLEDVARDTPHTVELILLGWRRWEQEFGAGALDKKVEVELEELELTPPPSAVIAAPPPEEDEPAGSTDKDTPPPKPATRPSGSAKLRITAASKPSSEVATAKYKQGVKQLARGQLAQAKESFWQCLANDPKSARCFRRLGEVCARLGDKAEALEYYGRSLELDPKGEGAAAARAYIQKHGGGGR
jgi:serine/threonine-protein kinase